MMVAGQEEVSAAGGIISWLARPHLSLVPRVCVLFCFNCFIRFRRRRHGQRGTHGQRGEANPCSHPSITRSTPSIHNSRTQGRTAAASPWWQRQGGEDAPTAEASWRYARRVTLFRGCACPEDGETPRRRRAPAAASMRVGILPEEMYRCCGSAKADQIR